MNTKPTSFRLTSDAKTNLERIAKDYGVTPNKVVNVLLTHQEKHPFMENQTAASHVVEDWYTDKRLAKLLPPSPE